MAKNKVINLESIVVQKSGLDSVDMDGEVVMMDIEKGKYYGFNSVASRIWQLINRPFKVREIISVLLQEFDVDAVSCEETVLKFLNQLCDEELVSVA